jgi:hypothetical protein
MCRGILVIGKEHDVTVRRIGVDGILRSSNIIRGVIESSKVVAVHAVAQDKQLFGLGSSDFFLGSGSQTRQSVA